MCCVKLVGNTIHRVFHESNQLTIMRPYCITFSVYSDIVKFPRGGFSDSISTSVFSDIGLVPSSRIRRRNGIQAQHWHCFTNCFLAQLQYEFIKFTFKEQNIWSIWILLFMVEEHMYRALTFGIYNTSSLRTCIDN